MMMTMVMMVVDVAMAMLVKVVEVGMVVVLVAVECVVQERMQT